MDFVGKYKRVSCENYEEMLKELGISFMFRKAACASTPVFEVSKEGDVWIFKTSTIAKSMELKFEIGKEFEETTTDGRQVKTVVVLEGDNKFVSTQTAVKEGEKSTKTVREFKDKKCVQVTEVLGSSVVCTQVFEKSD